ncbi:MAG: prepilin-type N-terminal cleavage/methylation domain-containing protein [Patescibacteria group bacterium]
MTTPHIVRMRRGFTLIELLVVIAIIGILASIVFSSINQARRKSRDARRLADLKQIQQALELYFDDFRQYPADIIIPTLSPTYMTTVPDDPLGNSYDYSLCPDLRHYNLGAELEDCGHAALRNDLNGPPDNCAGVAWGADGSCPTTYAICDTGVAMEGQGGFCFNVAP